MKKATFSVQNVSPLMKQHHVRSLDNKYVRVNYRTEKSDIEVYKTKIVIVFSY